MKRRIGNLVALAGLLFIIAAAVVLLFPESSSPLPRSESATPVAINPKSSPDFQPEVVAAPPSASPTASKAERPVPVQKAGWPTIKEYSSISKALEALRPAAEAGDVESMLAIARNFAFCRDGLSDPDNQKWVHQYSAQSGQPLADGYDEHMAELAKHCDLPTAQIQAEYRQWVLKAADSGESQAQLYAAMYPPVPDMVSVARESLTSGRDEREMVFGTGAQALSLRYARLARDQGELLAARMLINAPAEDGVSPGDLVEGYENRLLLSRIDASNGRPWKAAFLDGPAARLRQGDLEQAQRQVQIWLDTIPVWTARPAQMPEVSAALNEAVAKARADGTYPAP